MRPFLQSFHDQQTYITSFVRRRNSILYVLSNVQYFPEFSVTLSAAFFSRFENLRFPPSFRPRHPFVRVCASQQSWDWTRMGIACLPGRIRGRWQASESFEDMMTTLAIIIRKTLKTTVTQHPGRGEKNCWSGIYSHYIMRVSENETP